MQAEKSQKIGQGYWQVVSAALKSDSQAAKLNSCTRMADFKGKEENACSGCVPRALEVIETVAWLAHIRR